MSGRPNSDDLSVPMNFPDFLAASTVKQRLIFCMALKRTAPTSGQNVSETLESIARDIDYFSKQLTENDLLDAERAVKILVDVEGFPGVSEISIIDILQKY